MKYVSFITLFVFFTISIKAQQGLQIKAGANLVCNASPNLVLNNCGFYNNGDFNAGESNIVFTGTTATANSAVGGLSITKFYDITISKTTNDVIMQQDCIVDDLIIFDNGLLELNNFIIDLGATGLLKSESETSRITGISGGEVIANATLNAPSSANPGNLGAEITSTENLGYTEIRRGHVQQTDPSGNYSIYRYFDIIPENNSSLDATLIQYYFDAESGGLAENNFDHYLSKDAGVTWYNLGQEGRDIANNYVKLSGYGEFYRETLADPIGSPLPVVLGNFYAQCALTGVVLNWTTFSEINSSHFIIQRLNELQQWEEIANIAAQGYSTTEHYYSYTIESNTSEYYRLVLVDADGQTNNSSPIQVQCNSYNPLSIYPNPNFGQFTIDPGISTNSNMTINIFDISGKVVYSSIAANSNYVNIDIQSVAAGIYLLQLAINGNVTYHKIEKGD